MLYVGRNRCIRLRGLLSHKHHVHGAQKARTELGLQHLIGFGHFTRWQLPGATESRLHLGNRERQNQKHADGRDHTHPRTIDHHLGDAAPEAVVHILAIDLFFAHRLLPWPIDFVSDKLQECRHQRGGENHRDSNNHNRTHGQRVEDVDADKHHAKHRQDQRDSAKNDRLAGRGCGDFDRTFLRVTAGTLFTEAFDQEQRVINPDRQTEHGDHVLHEQLQIPKLPNDGDDTHRYAYRKHAQYKRHHRCNQRPEYEQKNNDCNRHTDHLGGNQLLGYDFLIHLVDGEIADGGYRKLGIIELLYNVDVIGDGILVGLNHHRNQEHRSSFGDESVNLIHGATFVGNSLGHGIAQCILNLEVVEHV